MNTQFVQKPSAELFFKGRSGDVRIGEWVQSAAIGKKGKQEIIALWGCPDDTGVTKNRGRGGAKLGPDSIRKHLYKMAMPMDFEWEKRIQLVDVGNLIPSTNIIETQKRCEQAVSEICKDEVTLLAFGGGHDFAAPNFFGWVEALSPKKKRDVALLNVDPHLDVRPLENGEPHSGTPFRQILDSGKLVPRNFIEFGIRANRNAREHYSYCDKQGVTITTLEEIREGKKSAADQFRSALKSLSKKAKTIAVTLDMDSCTDAEGTSAAPVIGFSAWELVQFAKICGEEKRVKYFEIAEVSPTLDPGERSSRIAAETAYAFLIARAKILSRS